MSSTSELKEISALLSSVSSRDQYLESPICRQVWASILWLGWIVASDSGILDSILGLRGSRDCEVELFSVSDDSRFGIRDFYIRVGHLRSLACDFCGLEARCVGSRT